MINLNLPKPLWEMKFFVSSGSSSDFDSSRSFFRSLQYPNNLHKLKLDAVRPCCFFEDKGWIEFFSTCTMASPRDFMALSSWSSLQLFRRKKFASWSLKLHTMTQHFLPFTIFLNLHFFFSDDVEKLKNIALLVGKVIPTLQENVWIWWVFWLNIL